MIERLITTFWPKTSPFVQARVTLTLFYFLCIAGLLTIFTLLTFNARESSYVRVHRVIETNTEGKAALVEFEQYFDEFNTRFKQRILLFDGFILLVLAWASWRLSGITLLPIQKMLEEQEAFAAEASHELRTPLTTMKMEVDMFVRKMQKSSEKNVSHKDLMTLFVSLKEEVEHMHALTEGLLAMVRNKRNQSSTSSTEVIDLAQLATQLLTSMKPVAEAKQIKLTSDLSGDTIKVPVHRQQVRQVLYILLDNALKYTPKQGRVLVGEVREREMVGLVIQDTGKGIAPKDLNRIFERWYRSSKQSRGDKGLGLGLAIAKKLVEQNRGVIEVESELTKGTTFRIVFPRSNN